MNVFVLGSFLLITLASLASAILLPEPRQSPVTEKSKFREAIKSMCPLSVVDTLFDELKPLQKQECTVWNKLNYTNIKLTEDNEKQVLCLLLHDHLISFCGYIMKLNVSNVKLDLKPIHNYTPEQVCKNLFPANEKLEYDLSKIITKGKCEKLCTDYEMTEPVVECSLAYYFAHFNISSLVPKTTITSDSDTTKGVQHSVPGASILGQQADTVDKKKSNGNAESIGEKPSPEVNDTKLEKKANEPMVHIAGETHDSSNGPKLGVNKTDSHIGAVSHGFSKKADKNISVIQPQPNRIENAHKKQETVGETLQTGVPGQYHEDSKYLPSHQNTKNAKNKISLATQNNIEANSVAGVLPNEVQVEVGTNDKINAEKDEGMSLNPDRELDDFGNLEDDDQGADMENEHDEPPDADVEHEQQELPEKVHGLQTAPVLAVKQRPKEPEKSNTLETAANEENLEDLDGGSYFFSYFMVICVFFVLGYVGYHNRIKVMALVLEGKRNKRQYRGRRPNSANYHKLDSNLEEAISSTCTKNSNNVIY